jgi:hypothetical protein
VASGVQERNWPGCTPSTFTRPEPSRIEAPSADTRPRTPWIRDSLARCAAVSPDGTITSRSGRTMWWKLAVADAAGPADGAGLADGAGTAAPAGGGM